MVSKRERIEMLMQYYAGGKKARLSTMLGGSTMLIAGWLKRDYIDTELVLQHFPEVNPHWLRSGEGEMLLQSAEQSSPASAEELVRLKAENDALKREVEWLRKVVENYLSKGKN